MNAMSSGIDPVSLPETTSVTEFDHARVAAAVSELLAAIGEDPQRDGLINTPARVARAYAELTQGMHENPAEVLGTTFDLGHQELVLVKDIEVHSLCEHHLMPFYGKAHIGYIPGNDGRITGLSKLARLVQVYAHRLQVQERMTTQIAEALMSQLDAAGCIVVIECEHMCMAMRGVRKPGALTTTSAVRGVLRDAATRAEAMALIVR